ncbi:hypothetical protein [Alloprevotella tannerae]
MYWLRLHYNVQRFASYLPADRLLPPNHCLLPPNHRLLLPNHRLLPPNDGQSDPASADTSGARRWSNRGRQCVC